MWPLKSQTSASREVLLSYDFVTAAFSRWLQREAAPLWSGGLRMLRSNWKAYWRWRRDKNTLLLYWLYVPTDLNWNHTAWHHLTGCILIYVSCYRVCVEQEPQWREWTSSGELELLQRGRKHQCVWAIEHYEDEHPVQSVRSEISLHHT